jgi:hypothetical protein
MVGAQDIQDLANEGGILAASLFAAAYVLATVLLIPASVLTLAAGYIFGAPSELRMPALLLLGMQLATFHAQVLPVSSEHTSLQELGSNSRGAQCALHEAVAVANTCPPRTCRCRLWPSTPLAAAMPLTHRAIASWTA